jgi:hypothetical protein
VYTMAVRAYAGATGEATLRDPSVTTEFVISLISERAITTPLSPSFGLRGGRTLQAVLVGCCVRLTDESHAAEKGSARWPT